MNKYLPLQKEVNLVKSNLSQAHLWLEEAIAGDPYIDIEKDVFIPFSHQSFRNYLKTAQDSLVNDQKVLKELIQLEVQLESFLKVAKQRWGMTQRYGIGSDLDQIFDKKFITIIGMIDTLSLHMSTKINEEIENRNKYFSYIVIFFLLMNVVIFLILFLNKRQEEKYDNKIKESTTRLSLALDAGEVGVWDWNIESNVTIWDDRMFEIYGLEKIVPMPYDNWINAVIQEDKSDAEADVQRAISTKAKTTGVFRIIKPDGTIRYIQSSADVVCDDSGKVIRVLGTNIDITELKQKDEMLINQSRHAAMGEMIGMIAHQWRQPLSTISMDANNMLLDIGIGEFSATASEEYANSIAQQTQHLSQTIDDFRNFFKPDKVVSKVNIRNILDQTLTIVKDSLKNNNIKLTSTFETELEVDAYPRELMQVFVNIITNSKDALVANAIKDGSITVRVYEDDNYINTEICDNGGGIDESILSKVFDPYFSTKGEKNGTGLGLYMSKMIIEEHLKGRIDASNSEEGACFTVRLLKNLEVK